MSELQEEIDSLTAELQSWSGKNRYIRKELRVKINELKAKKKAEIKPEKEEVIEEEPVVKEEVKKKVSKKKK